MALVKLGFTALSIPDKTLKAHGIVTLMTGNAAYLKPNPTLSAITDAADALETAYNEAADGGKSRTAIRDSKEAELNALMATLAAYIREVSGGDELIILSSGMEVRAVRMPPQDLPAPEALIAKTGDNDGQVNLPLESHTQSKSLSY